MTETFYATQQVRVLTGQGWPPAGRSCGKNTSSLALVRERSAFRGRRHDLVREPNAGNPHVGFAERRPETEPWRGLRHRHWRKPPATATPHVLPPPRQSSRGLASTMSGILVRLQEVGSGYAGLCAYGSQRRRLQSGMAGHRQRGHASIRILPSHGDMVTFTNDLESECLKGLDYAAFRGVAREAGHQIATPASATNASMTGESSANDSSPNV